jgi:glycosyltransferase involved in cell wall biosynthesis
MRILLVCDDFPSAFAGGTATSVMYLALGLGQLGHDVVLAWPEDPKNLVLPNVQIAKIPGHKFQLDNKNHLVLALPLGQRDLPSGWQPEVVHAMQPTPLSLALKWHTRRWQVPLLLSMHNLLEQTFSPWLRTPLSLWSPWVYRQADITVTPTPFASDYADRRYRLRQQAQTLSNSVDLKGLRRMVDMNPRAPLGQRTIKLCSAISLLPYKNPMMMLELIEKLRAEGFDVTLDLAGKGPMRTELETRTTELGLEPFVHFLGALGQSDVLALIQRSDAFLLTSRMEVQPMVLIESKAMGTPAFVSDAPLNGGQTSVTHGVDGLVFPVDDLVAATQIIATALQDPQQLESMGQAAYQDAEKYDIASIATQAVRLYERAIVEFSSRRH